MTKIKDNQLLNIYYKLEQKYHILIFSIFFIFLFSIISTVKSSKFFHTLITFYFLFHVTSRKYNTNLKKMDVYCHVHRQTKSIWNLTESRGCPTYFDARYN